MPRIANDPALEICPSFEGQGWGYLRQMMIDMHQGPQPLTVEEATQRLKDTWAQEHDQRVAQWQAQREQDNEEVEEQARQAHEEEEARRAQRDRELEEQRREAEKRKPKLNDFDDNRAVDSWIAPRPAEYALNKINALEYVELDYFTMCGCSEATRDANESTSHDTFGFTQFEGVLAIRPLAAQRASKNIRRDEDLTWEEMLFAKDTMLECIAKSGIWSDRHTLSLASFFVALAGHPARWNPHGHKILLRYQSQVRREWFSALKRGEGFNLELIREELMQSLTRTVNDQESAKAVAKEIGEVRATEPSPSTITNCSLLSPHPSLVLTNLHHQITPPAGCHPRCIAVTAAVPHHRHPMTVLTCPLPLGCPLCAAVDVATRCHTWPLSMAVPDMHPARLGASCAAVAVAVRSHITALPAVLTCTPAWVPWCAAGHCCFAVPRRHICWPC